ncbi:hypothetical protein MPTK1_1g09130 [Marchantia polymorpha subsp. ruderalis]|uniref:Bromo domain-containing protein n=1 Tax=Marchantia polymorpha subsp. ruderalis TaxID=1480154 RepID=A0AAF6AN62_MARPO|nr:hypothetical protein Mp_1g09130 [Marchantia polymorpha subsp. ruderalis]
MDFQRAGGCRETRTPQLPSGYEETYESCSYKIIKKKVNREEYTSPLDFAQDVRFIFSNAMTYNPQGHFVFAMAEQLRDIFEEKWKVVSKKIEENEHKSRVRSCQDLLTLKPHVEEPVHLEELKDKKFYEKVVDVQAVAKMRITKRRLTALLAGRSTRGERQKTMKDLTSILSNLPRNLHRNGGARVLGETD